MTDNSLGDADYYDRELYAGIWTRLAVIAIDSIVLGLVGVAAWIPVGTLYVNGVLESDPSGYFFLTFLILIWIYLAPIKRSNFGTLGYRILGVKLVSAKGGRPSLLNLSIRMTMWMLGPFCLLTDLLWFGLDSENQNLRDCYLGNYLVKRNAEPIGRAPVHLTRYCAMGYALAYPRVCRRLNDV